MCQDKDIKIFGKKSAPAWVVTDVPEPTSEELSRAKLCGQKVAVCFVDAVRSNEEGENNDYELLIQRRLLLSFTANICFERFIKNPALSEKAHRSFLSYLKTNKKEIYDTAVDTGAFSFYYLAYRRHNEVERRMGQTFAMLCSHDGDPIFQELGEAMYCWFSAEVKKIISEEFE